MATVKKLKSDTLFQLKITLKNIKPPIWRRVLVHSNIKLPDLHKIIQTVMGWTNSHLHQFVINNSNYALPDDESFLEIVDYRKIKLDSLITTLKSKIKYEYDFGDGWEHEIVLEKVLDRDKELFYPVCIGGKRNCPPEDCGGPYSYEELIEIINNPKHDEHDEMIAWLGGEFDPEEFDLEAINEDLRDLKQRVSREEDVWEDGLDEVEAAEVVGWMETLTPEDKEFAEKLPLRRDMIALLTYLRDTKVTGTKATGNFPLKAVSEICARFVEPVTLERKIGDKVYKVRSESEVWPLYFRHVLAAVPVFIEGGPGRRWKLTIIGERFLALPPALQIWIMCANWWTMINWAIAVNYELHSGYLDLDFRMAALHQLLELPLATHTDFKTFADKIIKDASLVWTMQDQKFARYIMHVTIERIVVKPQIDFGVLEVTTQPNEILGEDFQQISSILLTPFGKKLLESFKKIAFSD